MDYLFDAIAIIISGIAVLLTWRISVRNRNHSEKMEELNKQHEREMLEISFLLPTIVEIIEEINRIENGKLDTFTNSNQISDLIGKILKYLNSKKEAIFSLGFEKEFIELNSQYYVDSTRDVNACKKALIKFRRSLKEKYLHLLRER